MSLCDTCRRPGRCCTGFPLNLSPADTGLDVLIGLASCVTGGDETGSWRNPSRETTANLQLGLPFLPLWRTPQGEWRYWCPLLDRQGRCSDYTHRPAVCRFFRAGVDQPCAETPGGARA